jgi:hypothetical protein
VKIKVECRVTLCAFSFGRAIAAVTGLMTISTESFGGVILPHLDFCACNTGKISDILVQTTSTGAASRQVDALQTAGGAQAALVVVVDEVMVVVGCVSVGRARVAVGTAAISFVQIVTAKAARAVFGLRSVTCFAGRITRLAPVSIYVISVIRITYSACVVQEEIVTNFARGTIGRGILTDITVAVARSAQRGGVDEYLRNNHIHKDGFAGGARSAGVIRPKVFAVTDWTGQAVRG